MASTENKIQLKLPLPFGGKESPIIEGKNSVVLIGANGSGKTRMSIWIEENNKNLNVHRISAQKSLTMPSSTNTSDLESSRERFFYGQNTDDKAWLKNDGKFQGRWGGRPAIHLLDDFHHLMQLLFTEAFQKLWNDNKKTTTKLYEIKSIWETVITNKALKFEAGKIEVSNKNSPDEKFNGAEMSDGEREIFYFIGEVLCVPKNSVIIIDEPENHLHKSILIRLWNAIESARQDCLFVYITHDLAFAVSRNNSQIIWVKDMPQPNVWKYELLSQDYFPIDGLRLQILGSRQDVLLVEGKESSLDKRLYPLIFTEYNVIPIEGCTRVISFTKAFNALNEMHYCKVRGIVDRDRRTDKEIEDLNKAGVFCPEVAEIENLFLLPEVIRIVAQKLDRSEPEIENLLNSVKQKTFEFLVNHLEEHALLFTKQEVQNKINNALNKKFSNFDSYKSVVDSIPAVADADSIYENINVSIQKIIDEKNYLEALKVINHKGLLSESGLPAEFKWKQPDYIDYVLRLLSTVNVSNQLIDIFKQYIKIEE